MTGQLSRDTTLSMLEKTNKRAPNEHITSNNRLAESIAGFASEQQPTTILEATSTITLMFEDRNEKLKLFGDLLPTMLKMQLEMTEAMKINHFLANLRKEEL